MPLDRFIRRNRNRQSERQAPRDGRRPALSPLKGAWLGLLARLEQFRLVENGVAAVEFALVLPIMLTLYIGSVEASAVIAMDRKLQSVTGALGDLVARSDKKISAASLADYFEAASGIMTPHSTDELKQVVTEVEVRANGTTRVVWSREYRNGAVSVGTKHIAEASYNLPVSMTNIARGSFVIVAEGTYEYPPLYGLTFQQTINLYRQNFFMPRFGGSIAIN